jgi:hypothetical protein
MRLTTDPEQLYSYLGYSCVVTLEVLGRKMKSMFQDGRS